MSARCMRHASAVDPGRRAQARARQPGARARAREREGDPATCGADQAVVRVMRLKTLGRHVVPSGWAARAPSSLGGEGRSAAAPVRSRGPASSAGRLWRAPVPFFQGYRGPI